MGCPSVLTRVSQVGRTVYVGLSGRTNASGIAQLRAAFEPEDVTVVAVPTTKVLNDAFLTERNCVFFSFFLSFFLSFKYPYPMLPVLPFC